MNIYEFRHFGGEKYWVFAPDIKKAKDFYLRFNGCVDLSSTNVKTVPKSKWGEMYLLDPNESEPNNEEEYNEDDYLFGLKIKETFAEYAQRNTVTAMIATTEY